MLTTSDTADETMAGVADALSRPMLIAVHGVLWTDLLPHKVPLGTVVSLAHVGDVRRAKRHAGLIRFARRQIGGRCEMWEPLDSAGKHTGAWLFQSSTRGRTHGTWLTLSPGSVKLRP